MADTGFALRVDTHPAGESMIWTRGDNPVLGLPAAATVEIADAVNPDVSGRRHPVAYQTTSRVGDRITGEAEIETPDVRLRLTDQWSRVNGDTWRVDRRLEVVSVAKPCGVRLLLELTPALPKRAYDDFRYFVPPALYDLNDLNQDGVEDYLDTRSLHFREDRLTFLSLLAYSEGAKLGLAVSRADPPEFDPPPARNPGESAFLQKTDVGSLGIEPGADGGVSIIAAYPFAERTRSHALLAKKRSPFTAYWPATPGESFTASYFVRLIDAADLHVALWQLWTQQAQVLAPNPVQLPASFAEIAHQRVNASLSYYVEESDAPFAAGFVTNCHPQNGKQLSNVIQFGFTGQNNLNALNLLRDADEYGDAERRRKAIKVFDFFISTVARSKIGLVPGYYNADTRKFGSWWTGLILPLAYAEKGGNLEALMGPLYGHLREVIEALAGREGVYLRCEVEEYDALLAVYLYEKERGREHKEWFAACKLFANFLVSVQETDGGWFRGYDFEGKAIVEPENWFGQTDFQRKSSTAVAVPFLLSMDRLTGEKSMRDAARRAGEYVRKNFVDNVKFNGGIQDSIYALPQLVDGESIYFCMRALLALHKATGEAGHLEGARRAGQLLSTWVVMWDVPLPPESTLARYGFHSTGWLACDSPGAGYIHPMGTLFVPDLVELGLLTGDNGFLLAAELLQAGCNETVALPGKDWGYAMPGLQEEGALISWWFADDPMFGHTGFGGRGKGEGNKTCLPWISAVGVFGHQDLMARYGTADIQAIAKGELGR